MLEYFAQIHVVSIDQVFGIARLVVFDSMMQSSCKILTLDVYLCIQQGQVPTVKDFFVGFCL